MAADTGILRPRTLVPWYLINWILLEPFCTQFTCFTSTEVQILTQHALRANEVLKPRAKHVLVYEALSY